MRNGWKKVKRQESTVQRKEKGKDNRKEKMQRWNFIQHRKRRQRDKNKDRGQTDRGQERGRDKKKEKEQGNEMLILRKGQRQKKPGQIWGRKNGNEQRDN